MNIFHNFKYSFRIIIPVLILSSICLYGQDVQFIFFKNSTISGYDTTQSDNDIIHPENWQVRTSAEWEKIQIPFTCKNCEQIELKSTFIIDSASSTREIYLEFQGVGGSAEIYLNNKLLQYLPNAQIPISLKLTTESINFKIENELYIKFKISKKIDEGYPVFTHLFTEPLYLGILDPPKIILMSNYKAYHFAYRIKNIDTICDVEYSFELKIPENIINRAVPASIDYSIIGSDGKLYHRRIKTLNESSNSVDGLLKIPRSEFWSPDQPKSISLIYSISRNNIILSKQQYAFKLKYLRNIQEKFRLNGEDLIIKGINFYQKYEDYQDKDYFNIVYNDLKNIKNFGFNAVRFPGYFPDKNIVSMADSIGLLLFAELPIKRYPLSLFQNDNLLENTKTSIKHAGVFMHNHVALAALGIGQEIPLYEGSVQKFYLIIDGFTKENVSIPVYLSPIPTKTIYREKITDFYILDIYRPLQSIQRINFFTGQYRLAGKAAIIRDKDVYRWDSEPSNVSRAVFLTQEIQSLFNDFSFNGGFIESYQDWQSVVPTDLTMQQENPLRMPDGIMQANDEPKPWLKMIDNIWTIAGKTTIGERSVKTTTNFFSILMVVASLIFLAIYRKQYRLKDNLKRAIRHPYGFFVDMRERRIIPLFNSILVGAFSALILSAYLGSFFYYYRDSFWVQEIACLFLKPLNLYYFYLKYVNSPVQITLVFFIILFLYPLIVSIILYLFNFFSQKRIRYRQGLAIALWSGVPLFFLLPISIFGYHLLYYLDKQAVLFMILGAFILWSHLRIINGIRILFISKTIKIFVILLLSYIIPIVILWVVFRPDPYWYDYFFLLLNSKSLF